MTSYTQMLQVFRPPSADADQAQKKVDEAAASLKSSQNMANQKLAKAVKDSLTEFDSLTLTPPAGF